MKIKVRRYQADLENYRFERVEKGEEGERPFEIFEVDELTYILYRNARRNLVSLDILLNGEYHDQKNSKN